MTKSLLSIAAVGSALSFLLAILYVQLLFGLGSRWSTFFTVSDYFDIATGILPKIVISGAFGAIIGLFISPAYQPGESSTEYDARTGRPDGAKAELFKVWIIRTLAVVGIVVAPSWMVPIWACLLLTSVAHLIVMALRVALGGRVDGLLLGGDSWLRFFGLIMIVVISLWLWSDTLILRNAMRNFDTQPSCDDEICVGDSLLVSQIEAGRIIYRNGTLSLIDGSHDTLAIGGFRVSSGDSLLCRAASNWPPIDHFFESFCDRRVVEE